MLHAIYYDTETTGVKSDKDRIIELAAYDPVGDRTFCQFINPGCPIPKEATAIHNITDAMVENASDFATVMQKFIEFCPEGTILIAHNNDAFDRPFLEEECKRSQVDLPSFHYLDTLKWSRRYRPDLPKHSLQFLREAYGFAANQAHRALDDVIILYQVFSQMIDDLPLETVLDLYKKNQNQGQNSNTMPFGKYQGKPLADVPKSYVSWLSSNGALDKHENKDLKEQFEKLGLLQPA